MLKNSFWDVGQIKLICVSTYIFRVVSYNSSVSHPLLWFIQLLESTFCCLFEWGLNYRETVSTFSSSNELHVQLRCSCLPCCESHPAIDVIPWWFYTAASNILLFMRMCFHLLCAHICVCKYRLCKYIWWIHGRLCVCALCIYTHINLYAHLCVRVCMSFFTSAHVCVSTYPDYHSSAVCLTTEALSFHCHDSVLLHTAQKDKKWAACSQFEVIGLHLVSYGSQENVCMCATL